jgi:hypothetical protein
MRPDVPAITLLPEFNLSGFSPGQSHYFISSRRNRLASSWRCGGGRLCGEGWQQLLLISHCS